VSERQVVSAEARVDVSLIDAHESQSKAGTAIRATRGATLTTTRPRPIGGQTALKAADRRSDGNRDDGFACATGA
jgi:hypothetical protein